MSVPEAVHVVRQALEKGNIGRADILSRHMLEAIPDSPWPPLLLAEVALRVGDVASARRWNAEASRALMLRDNGSFPEAEAELRRLDVALDKAVPPLRQGGFLLIKCWGYGLWSDVEHVLSSLLLAEMTDRVPIVHWGDNSFYIDDGTDDAFGSLFEAIAPLTLAKLAAEEGDIYPPKYRRNNLDEVGLNIWDGPYSRLSGLYLLNRPERIVVSDFFTQVAELLPWLSPGHWLHGKPVLTAIRLLHEKYLAPAPDIRTQIDGFVTQHFESRPVLGVHVRNVDKALEDPAFAEENHAIPAMVNKHMTEAAQLRLFLMTDSAQVIETYRARYGERVFHTDCARANNLVPLTWRDTADRRQLGVEVILDTYIAAACDYFIGHGGSNVACMVACLKQWKPGTIQLIGDNIKTRRNWLLHDW